MRGSTCRLPATLTGGWEQLIGTTLEDDIIVSHVHAQINIVSYTAFVLLNVAAAS
jgi:hypothetical protein